MNLHKIAHNIKVIIKSAKLSLKEKLQVGVKT